MIISRPTHVSSFLSFLQLRKSQPRSLYFKQLPWVSLLQVGHRREAPEGAPVLAVLSVHPGPVAHSSPGAHRQHCQPSQAQKTARSRTWVWESRCSGPWADAESASIPKDMCWAHLPRQALSPCVGRSWKQASQAESMNVETAAPGTVMEREKEADAVTLPRERRILGHWKGRVTFESSFNPWGPMTLNKSVCVYKTGKWKHPKYLQSYRNSDTAYRVIIAHANSQNTLPVLLYQASAWLLINC